MGQPSGPGPCRGAWGGLRGGDVLPPSPSPLPTDGCLQPRGPHSSGTGTTTSGLTPPRWFAPPRPAAAGLSQATWEPGQQCQGSWHVPAPSLPSAGSPVPRHPPRALLRHLRWGVPSRCHRGARGSAKGDPPGWGAAAAGIPFPVSRGWEGLGPIPASPRTQLPARQNTTAPIRVRNPKVLGLCPKPRLQLLWAQRGPSRGWLSPAVSSARGRCPRGGPGPALGPTGHGDGVTRQGGPWASPGGWWPWGDAVAREVTRRLHVMPGTPRAGRGDGRGTGRHGGGP